MTQKMMGMSKTQDRDFIPVSSMQTYILQCCPKDLSTYNFPKTLKEYLLAEQLTY